MCHHLNVIVAEPLNTDNFFLNSPNNNLKKIIN